MSRIQEELRLKGKIEFEGATLVYAGEADLLQLGDTYVAERNDGPRLLTVRDVYKHKPLFGASSGVIYAEDGPEVFDFDECVKVQVIWET